MPANPSSAPSGPDVARQIAEQAYAEAISSLPIDARDEWSAIDVDTRNVWIRPAFVKAIARALADARREGEKAERDALKARLPTKHVCSSCGVDDDEYERRTGWNQAVKAFHELLRQRAAQEAPK